MLSKCTIVLLLFSEYFIFKITSIIDYLVKNIELFLEKLCIKYFKIYNNYIACIEENDNVLYNSQLVKYLRNIKIHFDGSFKRMLCI